MPWWADSGLLRTGGEFLYFVALAQMWNLLAGYGGIVSFGQQAFIGIGAYSIVLFAYRLGLDPFLAVADWRGGLRACSPGRCRSCCSGCTAPISPSAPGSWRNAGA